MVAHHWGGRRGIEGPAQLPPAWAPPPAPAGPGPAAFHLHNSATVCAFFPLFNCVSHCTPSAVVCACPLRVRRRPTPPNSLAAAAAAAAQASSSRFQRRSGGRAPPRAIRHGGPPARSWPCWRRSASTRRCAPLGVMPGLLRCSTLPSGCSVLLLWPRLQPALHADVSVGASSSGLRHHPGRGGPAPGLSAAQVAQRVQGKHRCLDQAGWGGAGLGCHSNVERSSLTRS